MATVGSVRLEDMWVSDISTRSLPPTYFWEDNQSWERSPPSPLPARVPTGGSDLFARMLYNINCMTIWLPMVLSIYLIRFSTAYPVDTANFKPSL